MSQCPQCYTGTCVRHRKQDHGKSKVVMPANSQQTLAKIYDQLVGAKLQKLRAESERDTSTHSTEQFRQQLDASRDKSIRKSAATSAKGGASKAAVAATGSGLNPQAFAAIYDDSASSESESDGRKRKKKSKKTKRKDASSKSKSSSSKKHRHRKRSHSDDSSDNSSDSDDSDSDTGSDDGKKRRSHHKSKKRSFKSKKKSKSSSKRQRRRDSD